MAHEPAGALQQALRVWETRSVKKAHVYVRAENVDAAERHVTKTCNRTAIMQKLADFIAASSHDIEPVLSVGSEIARATFKPLIDSGITLDGAVESQ